MLSATGTAAGHSTVFLYAQQRLRRRQQNALRSATGTAAGHSTVSLYGRFFGTEGKRLNPVGV